MQAVPAKEALKRIMAGTAHAGMHVQGVLSFEEKINWRERKTHDVEALPRGLVVDTLDLSGCKTLKTLPEGLQVKKRLILNNCAQITSLPEGLECHEIEARNAGLETLPADLKVEFRLDLRGCQNLRELPENLKVGTLILRDCVSLDALPEGLEVHFLDIAGCINLMDFPKRASIHMGRLDAAGCFRLKSLPEWLTRLAQLNVSGCALLTLLPENLQVSSWIDLARTPLTSLPEGIKNAQIRWLGIPIDERIAFHPETITAAEVLAETNSEKRRVLLERMGYESFIEQAQAEILDTDTDPGGKRQLLKVTMRGDEDLVCVAVKCPSTGRQYVIRVPPTMRTCHQAAAWIAGYDNSNDYHPVIET